MQMVEKMRYLQSYQARQAGGGDSAYHIVQVDGDGIPQPKVHSDANSKTMPVQWLWKASLCA